MIKHLLASSALAVLLAHSSSVTLADDDNNTSARALLGSSPYAHLNYGVNVVKGRAELSPRNDGANTQVVARLRGLKPGTTHIGHIHGGTCAALQPGTILHNLQPMVANSEGQGKSKTVIAESMDGLIDCEWWVAFHEGAANATPQTPAIAVGPVITRSRSSDRDD